MSCFEKKKPSQKQKVKGPSYQQEPKDKLQQVLKEIDDQDPYNSDKNDANQVPTGYSTGHMESK